MKPLVHFEDDTFHCWYFSLFIIYNEKEKPNQTTINYLIIQGAAVGAVTLLTICLKAHLFREHLHYTSVLLLLILFFLEALMLFPHL